MYAAGIKEAETVFCSVSDILGAPHRLIQTPQGKIKRTKSFRVDDFKYLKTLVPEEVMLACQVYNRLLTCFCPGCEIHQDYHVLTHLVSSTPWVGPHLRSVGIQ